MNNPVEENSALADRSLAKKVGFWSALASTILGGVYLLVLIGMLGTGHFELPPPEPVQLFAAVEVLLAAPLLLVLMACLCELAPPGKKLFSRVSLLFTVLFAAMVSINRFVQLTVVRHSLLADDVEGLQRFLPYEPRSAMFALELLGWGLFLGIAALWIVPLFRPRGLECWIRWSFLVYGVLGLTSALAYILDSPLSAVGFVAWGFVLYVATGLLAVWFRRPDPVVAGEHK